MLSAIIKNDFYKSRIDMHNLFIYRPIVGEMEQRTKLKKRYLYMGDEQPIYKIFNEKND